MPAELLLSKQRGALMIEALIAILVFSMGILGTVALQSSMLRDATNTKLRADASFLADQTLGTMWGDAKNLASYAVTDQTVANLPNGKRTVEISGNQVTVTISWQMPGESARRSYRVVAHISVNS